MLVSIVRVVGLAVLTYALLVFVLQRRVEFPGTRLHSPRRAAVAPPGVRQVWLSTSFGRVEAWLFEASDSVHDPTIVFAHGNGELIEDWRSEMDRLRASGMNALLVEFPGYGFSDGTPSRASLRETFDAAFDWLVASGRVDPDRIVAYGRSIGGGAAGDLTRDRPVAALALQSTFSPAVAMAREVFVPGFLVRDRWDNVGAVAGFAGPVLLMHGPSDEVIPYAHAQRLADARAGLKVKQIPCGHNDCAPLWSDIVGLLVDFLKENGVMSAAPPAVACERPPC